MASIEKALLLAGVLGACGQASKSGTDTAELLSGTLVAQPLDGARGAYGIFTGGYGSASGEVTTEVAVTMVFSEENIDVCAALTAAASEFDSAVVVASPADVTSSASAPQALFARASLQDAAALSLRITTAKSDAPYPGVYLPAAADASAAVNGIGAVSGFYLQRPTSPTATNAPLQIANVCFLPDVPVQVEAGQVSVDALASPLAGSSPGDISGHFQMTFRGYQADQNGLLVGGDSAGDLAGNFTASHCPVLDLTRYIYASGGR